MPIYDAPYPVSCDLHGVVHRPNGALTPCTVVVQKPQVFQFAFMNKIICCSYIYFY
jgi:hypothetical protein